MDQTSYLFIDGEYLRQRHREAMQAFFGVDGDLDLSPIMQQAKAGRGYFYDAIDDARRPGETEKEWESRVLSLEQFFAYVRSLPGFHVRPGSVSRGKKRQQKEVDVLLAVDMMEHGFNGSMSKAVLLTGDVDFRPVVEALVRHGVFVHVWYHRSSFAQELPGAADFGHEIRFRQLYEWNTKAFQAAHPIPCEQNPAGAPNGDLLKVGVVNGCDAELRKHPGAAARDRFSLWITLEPGHTLRIWDGDENLIERYVAVQYAPIEWAGGGKEVRIVGGTS
jgi:uncharacterized LabA/DUF88 family protein